ncbi:MAG: DUF2232 domain-containing protein, partial [Treponema sp.]|nr:DUF2232 domain-containing protein [Treponema sp.]
HAPGRTIWVLSVCLGMVLVFHRLQLKIPEIITWNLLVICGIVFLAQGAGIVLHLLQFRSQLTRMAVLLVFFVIMLSPGINAAGLGFLILLGIAENWLPFRINRNSSSTSTPGM